MRAGFLDPRGPKAWRAIPYALPALMLLFAVFTPIGEFAAAMLALAAFGIFNVLGLLDLRQHRPRVVELECGPGYIDVTKAGSRTQRIHARDITGATTARTATGLLLTLQHRKREDPITLELADDAEAEKVRHALGVGHGGFGMIAWQTQVKGTRRPAVVGRILAAAAAFLTLGATLGVSAEAGLVAAFFLWFVGFIGTILGLAELFSSLTEPSVVMSAGGLRLRTPHGWFALPYDAIHRVENHTKRLLFVVPEPYRSVIVAQAHRWMGGPSEDEQRMMVAQITAAAQRARGMGPQKNDVSGRIDVLRRHGESPRDWLVRLDMAGQMLSAGPGYRGNSLDVEDLWAILEDPEAEADLRAAAARVLRHSPRPEARVRIGAALAAVRDESTSRRLRVAIRDDLDGASEELAYLDATEQVPSARMQLDAYGRPISSR